MARFRVGLARTFLVTVDASNIGDAKQAAELFIDEYDNSTSKHQKEFKFRIEDIEMKCNDAFECEEVKEEG
jgi:hypothetical protein